MCFLSYWVEKLLMCGKRGDEWVKFPLLCLQKVGGKACFESNVLAKAFKGLDTIRNAFWKKAISVWLDLNSPGENPRQSSYNYMLYNNRYITYKQSHLWLPECIRHGIIRVRDICSGNRLMSFQEFANTYPSLPSKWMM